MLADYFLPRTSETERTLSGDGVAAVINAAHARSHKTIVLAAYDRIPLPLLRGVRQWQSGSHGGSRLAGALLFYPNLFGPPPVAGRDPVLDPSNARPILLSLFTSQWMGPSVGVSTRS